MCHSSVSSLTFCREKSNSSTIGRLKAPAYKHSQDRTGMFVGLPITVHSYLPTNDSSSSIWSDAKGSTEEGGEGILSRRMYTVKGIFIAERKHEKFKKMLSWRNFLIRDLISIKAVHLFQTSLIRGATSPPRLSCLRRRGWRVWMRQVKAFSDTISLLSSFRQSTEAIIRLQIPFVLKFNRSETPQAPKRHQKMR